MIDMLGVDDPLKKMLPMKHKPNVIVIHKGRDEEDNKRKLIRYKDIVKIRSKFASMISIAGGLELRSVRSAYFNGADIAIINVVSAGDPNAGLHEDEDISNSIPAILREVGN